MSPTRMPSPLPILRSPRATRIFLLLAAVASFLALQASALPAFCGFYVARADADLWNQASQVVLARDGDRTVLTMANDYRGDLEEFALVVPVPVVLQEGQIQVGERSLIERLDTFSAPRLVEYFDPNPCMRPRVLEDGAVFRQALGAEAPASAKSLGVTVEATYTVGEYDIQILSAQESDGLETWLRQNGYQLPRGASRALRPYIRQGLKFFVAKVNLEEQARTGYQYLRPLMMAYESPRFMLPIRLGMLNARGPQDLLVFLLTRRGRVETANYQTVKVPTGEEIPPYVKEEFDDFYRAMFERIWKREGRDDVFLEYFWDLRVKCDPCTADMLTREEVLRAGAFWVAEEGNGSVPPTRRMAAWGPDVRLTRLHVRYDEAHFPEDLFFKETSDRSNFQGRYILRHPFRGEIECEEAGEYRRRLRERQETEARTLARLTGWDLQEIRKKAGLTGKPPQSRPWWKTVFGGE